MFEIIKNFGITGRAVANGLLTIDCWNPRDYAEDKHKTVDDKPYGGGPGMIMSVYPLRTAIQAAREKAQRTVAQGAVKVIYVSPQGKRLDQKALREMAKEQKFIFVAGRYEGVDQRLIDLEVDEEWSIGDYVLSGGELAIMVILDGLSRLIPEVLGNQESAGTDSFSEALEGLLENPQYTRPPVVDGLEVPEVLLSGDHEKIARWRLKQSLGRTWQRRPELLDELSLDKVSRALLQEFIEEQK